MLLKTRSVVAVTPTTSRGHGLIETMRFDPQAHGGRVRNLGHHVARLESSAGYFDLPAPEGAEQLIITAVVGLTGPARVRLVLAPDGTLDVTTTPLGDSHHPLGTQRLCVDQEPVDSTDVTLFHKTTDRRRYEERARRHPEADDVILVNQRGEVTETTRANVAVCLDGQWSTPPLDCGLLPGIERGRLIASGQLVERVIAVEDLSHAEGLATLSSLRGWRPATVSFDCGH